MSSDGAHLNYAQSKKAYSKAPQLQSTTKVSAAFSRPGFEVNKTINVTQETQHNGWGISITNKYTDRKCVKLGYREKDNDQNIIKRTHETVRTKVACGSEEGSVDRERFLGLWSFTTTH